MGVVTQNLSTHVSTCSLQGQSSLLNENPNFFVKIKTAVHSLCWISDYIVCLDYSHGWGFYSRLKMYVSGSDSLDKFFKGNCLIFRSFYCVQDFGMSGDELTVS